MLAVRASLLAVFALISCALAIDLARAQDPTTETATTLHPGLNLVGWVGEPTPVSQLFREIPQLEAVWAWDAELDDWITAARDAPEWLGGLGRVWAGMGLRMQLGGDQPFNWQRSTEPTRGLVKLRTGWNLVAWSGADQTPIDDALKGIGWSLRAVHRWNPTTPHWSTWTSPERTAQLIAAANADQSATDNQAEAVANGGGEAETPAIRRGEALWINVARAVNWLQPTDILPRLVFPGGASTALQARVREDLEAVLAFFRTQYGIQADPDFTIYVPKDADALIQAWKDDGEDVDDTRAASTRALWNRVGGWAGDSIVVKQRSWPDILATDEIAGGRYLITHEYFHILQGQLSDGRASQWLVEGTANWIDSEHAVLDGKQDADDLRDGLLSAITNETPTLRSTERENAQWHYDLGWLATDQLAANAAPDFAIEFWRRLASTGIGPHGRWTSIPDWRAALQQVSGQPVSEFYTAFDAWQREQAVTNSTTAGSYDGDWIRGKVAGAGGEPVAGVFVNAIRVEGETSVGWNQRTETNADGEFAVRAPEDGDYRLSVDINDNCTRYYRNGKLVRQAETAGSVQVAGANVRGVDIRLPPNTCGWQIRGRIVGPSNEPLAGIRVSACPTGVSGHCYSSVSTTDGTFAVTIDESGVYRVEANLHGACSVYFRSGVVTTSWNSARLITVADAHVGDILIQVPDDLCRLRVAGSLENIERFLGGNGFAPVVNLCPIGGSGCASRLLERDGSFTVAVPTTGSYRLSYELNGCQLHHSPTGLTVNPRGTMRFDVGERDVRIGHQRVPDTMCAYQISGTIIGSDDVPLRAWVAACEQADRECLIAIAVWHDGDGSFAVTVPVTGSYRLRSNAPGCWVYFSRDGLTSNIDDAQLFQVDGRDIQLSPRQVSAGLCDQ